MKYKIWPLVCMVAAIGLMALPNSMVLKFGTGPGEQVTKGFSYFDLTVFGYGNFFALLTAMLTMFALLLMLLHLSRGKGKKASDICLAGAVGMSLFTLFFSNAFSLWGVAIAALLILAMVLRVYGAKE